MSWSSQQINLRNCTYFLKSRNILASQVTLGTCIHTYKAFVCFVYESIIVSCGHVLMCSNNNIVQCQLATHAEHARVSPRHTMLS